MELAGIVGMGAPQEGIRPDLLKYIFVKGPEASEQETGKTTFWVFYQSHEMVIPATAKAEPHGQNVSAVPDKMVIPATDSAEINEQPVTAAPGDTRAEVSAAKQRTITHFFSPCSSARHGSDSTRRVPKPSFITPCPSVRLAEVPAVFEVRSDCVFDRYPNPTMSLIELEASKSSSELSSVESGSSPAEVDLDIPSTKLPDAVNKKEIKKRFRQYSLPSIAATWHDRMASGSSKDETLLGSPAQGSEWSFVASSQLGKGQLPFDSFSSPPGCAAKESDTVSLAEDAEPDDAEADHERFWIEKYEERLAVINDMEKTMAGLKRELANTVTAFQMASEANHKLQAEVEKKTTTLSQMEEDMDELLHDLNVADMDNEHLGKDLAHSRIYCKHQSDRAEQAEAESHVITDQREMKSEIDFLESQVKERCVSVAHLTETLSRVADFDRWKDIQREMEDLRKRAGKLPEELQAAWNECAKWKKEHDTILEKHENVLVEQASLKVELHSIQEFDLSAMRELKRSLQEEAAVSIRALKKCLKQVFERMVRCSLCLETEGYLPFDRKHRAIYERVSELTGRDYQQRLIDFYNNGEQDIQGEFHFGGEGFENDDDNEGTFVSNNRAQLGNQEPYLHGNDQEHTQDSSFAPIPGTTEGDIVTGTATQQPASPNPASSNGPAFLAPIFQSSDFRTQAINDGPNVGKPFDFGFSKNPPPPLFASFTADSETKPGEGSTSAKSRRTWKSAEATNSSTTKKGNSQGIWNNTSFATGESNPFASNTTASAKFEAKSNAKSPIFNSFPTSQPAVAFAATSHNPETEQDTEGTEASKEADPSVRKTTLFSTPLHEFNFGGTSSPSAFTGSSSSFSPRAKKPPPAGTFPFGNQTAPSMTVQPKDKAVEDEVPKGDNSKADMSQIEPPKEKVVDDEVAKREDFKEDVLKLEAREGEASSIEKTLEADPLKVSPHPAQSPKNEKSPKQNGAPPSHPPPSHPPTPNNLTSESPSPSPVPNRSQTRAAKKAAKHAETEARIAKAQAKRRVERVMMMK